MENCRKASIRSLRALDWLNFFLADVQSGVGPFVAIYLAGYSWNEQRVGMALAVGGIAGIVTQTPAGDLVDRLRCKRALVAIGVTLLAAGALMTAYCPSFWPVLTAQTLIGGASSVFGPAVAAISLGLVGYEWFDCRQGRNQTFNSAGNVIAAALIGWIGYSFSNRGIFFFVVLLAVPTLLSLRLIRPGEIDHALARGARNGKDDGSPTGVVELLKDRPLFIFAACAVLFHFANAAMLPLLGEMLAIGRGRDSMMFMSACVITTQVVIALTSTSIGYLAGRWGRKPLLLIGFGVLPLRGVLYCLTHDAFWLVMIQVLDGIGAGVFGVVSLLVIADLTRGTGRFNLASGAIATAVGLGASLSQIATGAIVHHAGYQAGFLFLAAVATGALAALWWFLPETKEPA